MRLLTLFFPISLSDASEAPCAAGARRGARALTAETGRRGRQTTQLSRALDAKSPRTAAHAVFFFGLAGALAEPSAFADPAALAPFEAGAAAGAAFLGAEAPDGGAWRVAADL